MPYILPSSITQGDAWHSSLEAQVSSRRCDECSPALFPHIYYGLTSPTALVDGPDVVYHNLPALSRVRP